MTRLGKFIVGSLFLLLGKVKFDQNITFLYG